MASNPYSQYKQMQVATTDPVRLIVMLYDGAIRSLKSGIEKTEQKDFEGKGRDLMRAYDIVFELLTVLDYEKGGEIAANLAALYNYILKRILEANAKMDTEIMQEAIRHLETLNDAWRTLAERGSGNRGGGIDVSQAAGAR